VRYGQADSVIASDIIPRRPRLCAHAAFAVICNRSPKALRAGLTPATDPLRTTTERPVTAAGGTNRLIEPSEAAAIMGAERGSPPREDKEWRVRYITRSHYLAWQPSAQKSSAGAAEPARSGGHGGEPHGATQSSRRRTWTPRLPTPCLIQVLAPSYSEVVFGQSRETKKMSQQARLEWPVTMDRH
jgi:hypothetical protein